MYKSFGWMALATVVLLLLSKIRQTYEFVIVIEQGRARLDKGKAPSSFLRTCSEAAWLGRIQSGTISGEKTGDEITLKFSEDFPEDLRQRIRNIWGAEQLRSSSSVSRISMADRNRGKEDK